MQASSLETLRKLNGNLRTAFFRLTRDPAAILACPLGDPRSLTAQLKQAARLLQEGVCFASSGDAMAGELSECRSHLERLAQLLPSIHGHLLAEKARLATARRKVAQAAAWAAANKNTL